MVQSVYHLISTTLSEKNIPPSRLVKALNKILETLKLYNENAEKECLIMSDTIKETKDFIIILELCELFRKIGRIKEQYNQYMRGQVLEVNKIAKIFLDPLAEKGREAEAILLEKYDSIHLVGELYWEKWKVKFLEEDQSEENEEVERFILAIEK